MPTKKIYTNTLAQIAGKIATALISIFMIKILTVYLDVSGYGLYSKIYNYLSIFAVIADMGIYTITVRELSKYQDNPEMTRKISGNVLSIRTISWLLIIILSVSIAPLLDGYNSFEALLAIGIVGIFTLFWLINSSLMSTLQAMLKTEFSFFANTWGKMLTFLLILAAAYLYFPVGSTDHTTRLVIVMLAGLCGNICMTALTWWYTKKQTWVGFAWDPVYIRTLLKLSLPYGLALFLGVIFFKVDVILLSIMEPSTVSDSIVALYALPMKIVEVGMMYGTIFLNSFLPVLTASIETRDHATTRRLTRKGFHLLMGFWTGIAVMLFFFAPEVIRLISTEAFTTTHIYGMSAVQALQVVSWIFLCYFIASLSNYILIARGEQKKILYINTFIALINIIGNILVIPHFSFLGAAWITLITQILLVSITWWMVRDIYEQKQFLFAGAFLLITGVLSGYISTWVIGVYLPPDGTHLLQILGRSLLGGIIFGICYLSAWYLMYRYI